MNIKRPAMLFRFLNINHFRRIGWKKAIHLIASQKWQIEVNCQMQGEEL